MGAKAAAGVEGDAVIKQARKAATTLMASFDKRDGVSLVLVGSRPHVRIGAPSYNHEQIQAEIERLWTQVEPLYLELHTYVRRKLIEKYGAVRRFAPALLETFEFRGGGAMNGLLRAVTLIRNTYRAGKRASTNETLTRYA